MDIHDYEKMEEKIERAIASAFKSVLPEFLEPIKKRLELIERTQEECPARKSARSIQTLIIRGLNLAVIAGLIYLAKVILRPEVWAFIRTVASIE